MVNNNVDLPQTLQISDAVSNVAHAHRALGETLDISDVVRVYVASSLVPPMVIGPVGKIRRMSQQRIQRGSP